MFIDFWTRQVFRTYAGKINDADLVILRILLDYLFQFMKGIRRNTGGIKLNPSIVLSKALNVLIIQKPIVELNFTFFKIALKLAIKLNYSIKFSS